MLLCFTQMPEYLDLEHLRATGPQPGEQLQPEDAPSAAPAAGAPVAGAPAAGIRGGACGKYGGGGAMLSTPAAGAPAAGAPAAGMRGGACGKYGGGANVVHTSSWRTCSRGTCGRYEGEIWSVCLAACSEAAQSDLPQRFLQPAEGLHRWCSVPGSL